MRLTKFKIMKTPTVPIEDRREFNPFFRSRRAAMLSTTENLERSKLIHHYDDRAELRGSSHGDYDLTRDWSAHFQHESTFPSAPLPVTAPQPKASNAVYNRVLIADDDSLVRGSLAAVLESEGFVVDEAQNGIEAVTRAIDHAPDLVLLDLNMPHWDGWTAFSQLDRVTPLLPVIVITARPNQYPKAVKLGVDAFMEKPLNISILVRAIKHLTREDENRHVRRTTNRAFVTLFLGSSDS
jgi:CheY-like chemotaxis protein